MILEGRHIQVVGRVAKKGGRVQGTGYGGQYTIQIIRCASYWDFDQMHLPFVKYLHRVFEKIKRSVERARAYVRQRKIKYGRLVEEENTCLFERQIRI